MMTRPKVLEEDTEVQAYGAASAAGGRELATWEPAPRGLAATLSWERRPRRHHEEVLFSMLQMLGMVVGIGALSRALWLAWGWPMPVLWFASPHTSRLVGLDTEASTDAETVHAHTLMPPALHLQQRVLVADHCVVTKAPEKQDLNNSAADSIASPPSLESRGPPAAAYGGLRIPRAQTAFIDLCPGSHDSHSISWADLEPLYLQPQIPGAFRAICTSEVCGFVSDPAIGRLISKMLVFADVIGQLL
ncbi:hypothetical protein ACRRTK_007961 [Alexandromys fortis]